MPTARIAYVDQPFAQPRVTPDYSRLAALYQSGGAQLASLALQRGQITSSTLDRLGSLFSGFRQAQDQQKAATMALALRREEKKADLDEKAKDRTERADERKEAARLTKETQDRAAAGRLVDDTPAGPVEDTPESRVMMQLASRFPETAARFQRTQTLPARPVDPSMPSMGAPQPLVVRTPTGTEMRQAGADQRAVEAQAAAAKERTIDNSRADANLARSIAAQQSTEAHQREMERIAASKSPSPIAGNFDLTGDEFLKTIPAQWRQTVKKIAAYEEDPTKVASMRGGMREQLMQWVNQANPGYKADEFSVRAPTRKAYTTGTQGQQINAINTALGHIDQLDTLVTALGNKSFVPGNELANWASKTFGGNKVTNFDTLKDALSAEVASVLSKGQATVSEIAEQREKIHAASSPAQLVGYIKTQIPIMGSKLASLDYQYHQAMGPDDDFSALSPLSKSILEKHGFDYTAHASSTPQTPAAGAVRVLSITPVTKP
jgi:hypothetical protein